MVVSSSLKAGSVIADERKRKQKGANQISILTGKPTTSSPELPVSLLPELFDFEARPRSWSAQDNIPLHRASLGSTQKFTKRRSGGCYPVQQPSSPQSAALSTPTPQGARARGTAGSVRAPSIRSSTIRSGSTIRNGDALSADTGIDKLAAQSVPSIATTFAGDAYPVEARGQMVGHFRSASRAEAPPSPPPLPKYSRRSRTLHMIKPLVANSNIPDKHEDLAPQSDDSMSKSTNTTAINSASDDRDSMQHSEYSMSQADKDSKGHASHKARASADIKASPTKAHGILHSPKPDEPETRDQRPSLWSAFSRLTLQGPKATAVASDKRKSAIDCLREIESKQPASKDNIDEGVVPASIATADADVPTPNSVQDTTSAQTQKTAAASKYWVSGWWTESSKAQAPDSLPGTDTDVTDIHPQIVGQDKGSRVDLSAERPDEGQAEEVEAAAEQPESPSDIQPSGGQMPDGAESQEPQAVSKDQPSVAASNSSGWIWGWFGTPKQAADAASTEIHGALDSLEGSSDKPANSNETETSPSIAVRADAAETPAASSATKADDSVPSTSTAAVAAIQENNSTESLSRTQGHNAQAQRNMLLPDLDFSACAASASFVGSHRAGTEPTSKRRLSDESITMDIDAQEDEANQPLKKRLRLLGRSVLDSVVEYSPEWFRSYVEGQKLADRLGQLGYDSHSSTYHGPTREQVKDSMDAEAKRLGKVAVIGIHGWFPTKMLQMVAGEPTGKSEKFCMMMRDALQSYLFEMHGVSVSEEDISLFPLVGEGKIEDRVDLLLSQIIDTEPPQSEPPASEKTRPKPKGKGSSSSSDTPTSKSPSEVIAEALMPARSVRADVLQAADTVFIVTHSQGTPVSALLVEQLMEMGLVDTSRQHVGMLAMAGISHGPLPYLRDNVVIRYIESEAARELFELMDPSSPQSQRYVAALSTILHKGVRLVCIGSWVDEVVPLYSAILQGVSHPNVYRAVYIDAPHYFDDFLTSLIVFALRLRNMGIYDHDLLIHLSEVVAGSLWGHSGHSTVYGEPGVFKLLIKWLLYSTSSVSSSMRSSIDSSVPVRQQMQSISGGQIHMSYRPFNASERLNPFFIPWIMRTLWDDPEIRQSSELRAELKRLVVLFDKWRPETKAGKELKYRLEPVRAAL